MRPLSPPREIPTTPRYLTVELPERGVHGFKLPTYGTIDRLTEWAKTQMDAVLPAPSEEGAAPIETPADFIAVHEVVSAALIGAAWFHRGMVLDAVLDLSNLEAYGAAVADEMQDRGYTYAEIAHLGNHLRSAMIAYFNAGMALKTEAIAAGKPSPA